MLLSLGFFLLVTAWAQLLPIEPLPLTLLGAIVGGGDDVGDSYFGHDRCALAYRAHGHYVVTSQWHGPHGHTYMARPWPRMYSEVMQQLSLLQPFCGSTLCAATTTPRNNVYCSYSIHPASRCCTDSQAR